MSDILLHAALVENQSLLRTFIKKSIDPNVILDVEAYNYTKKNDMWLSNNYTAPINQCPNMVKQWQEFLTPLTLPRANGFKVCDGSGYWRCQSNCAWTVPTGVTEAQFQVWGHGGGNSANCCCGGAPFGPTGGYMTAVINVVPGEIFCLYSGCAYCCYANQTTPGYNQDTSYVCSCSNSNGCFNIAVIGAAPEYNNWCISAPSASMSQCGPPTNDGCNPSSCSGWNFCWDTAGDNVTVPHFFSKCDTYCVCCNTRSKFCAYGIPTVYPALVIGSDLSTPGNGYHISPPVFGFEQCTCCWGNCTLSTVGSLCNGYGGCHYSAQNGYQQIPAVGGFGSWVCGGYTAGCGDAGGMGMICVSWNCS